MLNLGPDRHVTAIRALSNRWNDAGHPRTKTADQTHPRK